MKQNLNLNSRLALKLNLTLTSVGSSVYPSVELITGR